MAASPGGTPLSALASPLSSLTSWREAISSASMYSGRYAAERTSLGMFCSPGAGLSLPADGGAFEMAMPTSALAIPTTSMDGFERVSNG